MAPLTSLGQVADAVDGFHRAVAAQVVRARADAAFAQELNARWRAAHDATGATETPSGLRVPRRALPTFDDPGEIARYLYGEGLPGEFPYLNGAYPEMYLDRDSAEEEPTRMFSGFALAEDTNERFHYLTRHQRSKRLSTAFDGPTLYGVGSGADGVFGKIGEGGVAVDTVDDMERLYAGFPLDEPTASVSMTINGPAPIILAMYVAAAKRRFGPGVEPKLRGTIQADVLKEVQAQNEMIFPIEASLRFLGDMVEHASRTMPRWYPVSISGYHIAEAGATPVQQAAYTLSNGFAYVEQFIARGMDVDVFGPRLSFFLDGGLDLEYLALARVCRRIWAIGMREVFGAGSRAQVFKLHTQTSGRSLVAHEFKNNLSRTAIELVLACMNGTNSCHSNGADEPFTTPSVEYARLGAHAQAIVLEESGLFRHMMNAMAGSPGMNAVGAAVEAAVLEEFRAIDAQGGVAAAVERRYQRSQIQASAHRLEQQINDGRRPVIGLNRYNNPDEPWPVVSMVRTPREKKERQLARLHDFEQRHRASCGPALERLATVVENGGNVFTELIDTVESCSLGQITARLQECVGRFRPMV